MLKLDEDAITRLEGRYPGIRESILQFEKARLPCCPHCGSDDTADVQIGLIGRTIQIASATTKFRLVPNAPKPGRFFCNTCNQYYNR